MRSIYFVLASGTAIATLLSFIGSLWWGFALLEHARPQYCLALLVALLIGVLNRKPWRKKYWMLLWLLPLLVNLSLLLPVFLPTKIAAVATQDSTLQLLHVTLDHENSDISSALAYIDRQAPEAKYRFRSSATVGFPALFKLVTHTQLFQQRLELPVVNSPRLSHSWPSQNSFVSPA